MFMVDEASAAAIREAYEKGGELAAAVELRQRFPGIQDNVEARKSATRIAGWPTAAEIKESFAETKARRDAVAGASRLLPP
jgi:hypothetical protein